MTPRPFEDLYALAPTQLGLLAECLRAPDSRAYLTQIPLELRGALHAPSLAQAWRELVARHAVLRTSFAWEELETPLQIVHAAHAAAAALEFCEVDLRGLPEPERGAAVVAWLVQDAERGFALDRAPLMRVALLALGPHHFVQVWSHHHLILDGWSVALLLEQLLALYASIQSGGAPDPHAVPAFRSFIAWLADRGSHARRAHWDWQGELGAARAPLPAPAPPGRAPGSFEARLELGSAESEALRRAARRERVTLNTLIQGAWAVLLARHGSARAAVFGVTSAGRPAEIPDVERIVGPLLTTLPLRVTVPADAAAGDWLRALQQRNTLLREHEHTPLPEIRRACGLAPEAPLFESLLVFDNYPIDAQALSRAGDLEVALWAPAPGSAGAERAAQRNHYPLSLIAFPQERLWLALAGERSRVDARRARDLLEQLRAALHALVRPGARLRDVGRPGAGELAALRARSRSASVPPPALLPQRVAELAEAQPDAVAVEDSAGRTLTYAGLEARSAELAAELARQGVRAGDRVLLELDRCAEWVAAALAVWRLGAAYVPLDPALPPARRARIERSAAARARLGAELGGAPLPPVPAREALHAASVAYRLYTSGSTGEPKPIDVSQHGLAHYLAAALERLAPPRGARFAVVSTLAADLCLTSLFAALYSGGSAWLIAADCALDPGALAALFARRGRPDVLKIAPAQLRVWLAAERPAELLPRALLVLGGEALQRGLVQSVRALAPGLRIVNHYGPSEATVGACTHEVPPDREARGGPDDPIPIGRPLGSARLYVVDTAGALAPDGGLGELAIGGETLALGYPDDPRRTAERFAPDPFAEAPGARLYRTGDRARWNTEQQLEFAGRSDDQVSLHGVRVELGDVEAALRRLPGVRAAAAQLRRDPATGAPRLLAWVEADAAARDWRAELRAELPEPMLPSIVQALDALPLTASGKLDRHRLPEPAAPAGREPAAPANESEAALLAIWRQVLARGDVGADGDFFALGGDSILGLQIVARARRAGLALEPRDVFEHPTLRAQAARCRARSRGPEPEAPAPEGRVPLLPIQRAFFEVQRPDPHHFNQALLLELPADATPASARAALLACIARHPALSARFVRAGGGVAQLWGGALPGDPLDVLAAAEALEPAAQRLQRSLALERGALLRGLFVPPRGAEPALLLLAAHHLAIDAVSWGILLEDLGTALGGSPLPRGAGGAAALAAWARHLEAWAASPELAAQLAHWQNRPPFALPCDVPAGRNALADAQNLELALDPERSARLLRAPAPLRSDTFLLCALGTALARWAGARGALLEVESHGRLDPRGTLDLSGAVGWLTCRYPLALRDLDPASAAALRLARVREQLEAVPDGGLGYGALRYLSPHGPALAALPVPPVSYNNLGQLDALRGAAGGLRVRDGAPGDLRSPHGPRGHLIDVTVYALAGRVHTRWTYSGRVHAAAVIARAAQDMQQELCELLDAALAPGAYALAPLQRGLLFHALAAPRSRAYVNQLTAAVEGELDVRAFEAAWQALAERHPALRTRFAWRGLAAPLQVAEPHVRVPVELRDLGDAGTDEADRHWDAWLAEDLARGFELDRAPLLRVLVARCGARRFRLCWTRHHLLLDGWSSARALGELLELYAAAGAGRSPALEPARPFRDHVEWLAARRFDRDFWSQRLAGSEPCLVAPGADGDVRTWRSERLLLDAAQTSELRAAARSLHVTPATLFQGAFALLLGRWLRTRDVLHGITLAGRPAELAGSEAMLGLFINTLPARVRVDPAAPLGAWLQALQRDNLALREREHDALGDIQRASGHGAGAPLFDALFVFENYPRQAALAAAGLELVAAEQVVRTHYPLTWVVSPHGDGYLIEASYDAERLAPERVAQALAHGAALLRACSATPGLPLGALDPLSPAERDELARWSHAREPVGGDVPVHERFAALARARPSAAAVCAGGQQLTYAQLGAQVERVARALRRRLRGPEPRVAACLPRDAGLAVALLAALRAGAVYVPLDPSHPDARLAELLRDCGAELLLAPEAWRGRFPADVPLLALDAAAAEPEHAAAPAARALHPEQLAYVIYTSGSSGRPKGVAVSHRSLARLFETTRRCFDFGPADRWSLFHSAAFDFSVWEILGPLSSGGCLVVVPEALRRDPPALLALLAEQRVSVLSQTPAAFDALLASLARASELPALRWIVFGGDELRPERLRPWFARFGRAARLANLYGITETTVHVTFGLVDPDALGPPSTIGHPLPDLSLHLLDLDGQRAAPGALGELCVGGPGLARGYLGQPARTAERFVPDPFAREPGARLYRSGDLGQLRNDALLEYHGRSDRQLKLRGHRIEPGEIERVLATLPGVRDCAVVLRRDPRPQLVAYVAADEAAADAWRAALRARLPAPLVPAHFVRLAALPLTPNGKLDRRALPAPGALPEPAAALPTSAAEQALHALFVRHLGRRDVGADADFFALGGDSLLAVQLAADAQQQGLALEPRLLFEHPSVRALARALAGAGAPDAPRAGPALGDAPLAPAQRRIWFLEQLEPGTPSWHVPLAFDVHGSLDRDALERALEQLVARHAILRSAIALVDGEPVQRVLRDAPVALDVRELGSADPLAHPALRAAVEAPFDLERPPLLRALYFRRDGERGLLALVLHHLAVDALSLGVLLRDLAELYGALREGRPARLPELPLQYGDYARWQHERSQRGALAADLAYWRGQLRGLPALELPVLPAASGPRRGVRLQRLVPRETAARLDERAAQRGATRFMWLAAALQSLLARYSGQRDVAIGAPVAERSRAELADVVGCFLNTVVLRGRIEPEQSFDALLAATRKRALEAYAHQALPFEQLVEGLASERGRERDPLFQVQLVLQDGPRADLALPGVSLRPRRLDTGFEKLPLALFVEENAAGLRVTFAGSLLHFEAAALERLADHFGGWLELLAAQPERPLAALRLVRGKERELLLRDFNATTTAGDLRPVHERFEAQARATPDAVAAELGSQQLCYSELNARANRLARRLQRDGARRGDVVALCLERSLDLLVAILAALKAGCAWLPLDPEAPAPRNRALLGAARAAAVLVEDAQVGALGDCGVKLVARSALEAAASAEPGTDLGLPIHPLDLAYVLWTSGSTGAPKAVQIPHAGLANRLVWQQRFASGSDDRILQKTPSTFDVSVWELLWPLTYGARVVLAPPGAQRDPLVIAELIERHCITCVHFVPSLLAAFLEARPGQRCASLRRVIASGEALAPELVRACSAELGLAVDNLYGPSEASIDVAAWSCSAEEAARVDAVPIGRPIANTRLYVLDAALEPVPLGAAGELCIGGAALARGYRDEPRLTAERFVPDPFAPEPGARLYRSGDRARWRADGELLYLGRLDAQLKLRGQRIEPGEIESELRREPGVRAAAVSLGAAHELHAHVVADPEVDLEALRAALAARLPSILVPARIARRAALPLTASGKLDRRALPDLARGAPARPAAAPPAGSREAELCALWSELLERPVGVHDDVFELGAHSLLAARFLARLRERHGLRVALRDVFEHPTVAALAARARPEGPRAGPRPTGRTGPLPLAPAQQRLWFLEQLQPGSAAYHVPVPLRLRGALDPEALERALGDLVARHAILRTRFPAVGGVPLQVVEPATPLALARHAVPADLLRALRERAFAPFDLARGPLVRADLWPLADGEWLLLLGLHHIVSDAWSLGVLLDDLAALYAARASGRAPALAPLALQYADFAVWQCEELANGRLQPDLDHWRAALAELPALDLPLDRPRPPRAWGAAERVPLALGAPLAQRLEALARERGVTPYMMLLAAWQTLLGRVAGQDDVAVGSPVADRPSPELEALVGCFVNSIVLRGDLRGDPPFAELLARTRERVLGALAHARLPFESLVEALRPERDASRTPLFQVMLLFQNAPRPRASLGDLQVEPLALAGGAARFDLTLALERVGDHLTGSLEFRSDLFERATIERLARGFERLLAAALEQPDARLSALAPLAPEERERAVATWNATATPYPRDATVHGRFEAGARAHPERSALSCGAERLTYGDLNARANALAHALLRAGIAPEARVGLALDRSIAFIVGALGILKAGAAFVPIEPDLPPRRRCELLGEVGATALVCSGEHGAAPAFDGPVLDLACLPPDARDPGLPVTARNLAYVMHTSGSTGRPKGVAIEHRAVVRLVADVQYAALPPGVCVLHAAPPAFDAATFEIWGALLNGGHCAVLPAGVPTAAALARAIRTAGASIAWLTASLFNRAVDEDPMCLGGLRELLVGGEALSPAHVDALQRALPDLRITNGYGPTENTTFSATHRIPRLDGALAAIPIGRPIDRSRALVLDARLEPVPPGVLGELYVGGDGLARGYLGRPALTAERFMPDPFAAGERLYRTGDLARYRNDGSLLFAGRRDGQLKLRGHRIEPSEIEARLCAHPGVSEAAVVLLDAERPQARLAAYVTAREPGALAGVDLRAALAAELPRWMQPTQITLLEQLPRTPSGKLDRRALPALERPGSAAVAEPRDALESALCALWAELLGQPRVGIRDDFFELGGHSLLAAQVAARVAAAHGCALSVEAVFLAPTVEQLAARVREAAGAPPDAIRRRPRIARSSDASDAEVHG